MSTTLKLTYQGELRRVPIQESLSYSELKQYAINLFPTLKQNVNENVLLEFAWIDDENDCIMISSDLELEEAFRTMRSGGKGYLRFEVRVNNASATTTTTSSSTATPNHHHHHYGNQIHVGITCDECNQSPIVGIRYKCSVRGDFDICQNCEKKSIQPFPMIKFYEPKLATSNSHIVVAINNPNEKFFKRHERAKTKEWKEKKHRGVRCDECGVRPITGIRYKCTHRPDFDLCSECEAKKRIQPYPMIKIYSPDQCPDGIQVFTSSTNPRNPQDITIECDIDMSKGMKILRELFPQVATAAPWNQWSQESSNATSTSATPSAPPPPEFAQSNDPPIHRFIRCNECGMKPIMGYRYKCSVRPDFDLCGTCEAKGPQPFPMMKIYNSDQNPRGFGFGGRGGRCGRSGKCGGRWGGQHWRNTETVEQDKIAHNEKETRELEDDIISATLEQSMSESIPSSYEESKTSSEIIREAVATLSTTEQTFLTTAVPAPPINNKTMPTISSKPMARFVRDVTMPDGTSVQPSSNFVKTWRIRNDGMQSWPEGCFLVNAGGDHLFNEDELRIPVASVHAGEEVDLSVTLTAPSSSGRHVGYFRLQDSEGNWFGQRLWSDIRVNEVEDNLWHVVGNEEDEIEEEEEEEVEQQQQEEEAQQLQQVEEVSSAPLPPSDSEIWAKELNILASMGFVDHDVLIPLLKTHLVTPAEDTPNPEGMQILILSLF